MEKIYKHLPSLLLDLDMGDRVVEANRQQQDGRAGFDFILGRWNAHIRQLKEWLKGSADWMEYEATVVIRPLLGGLGNLEELALQRTSGTTVWITMRLFDATSQQWRLYWVDSTRGVFNPPFIGGFTDGHGEFYSQEEFAGKAVYGRFIWSHITATTCFAEQAYSQDGGRTWETNLTMEFTRSTDA